MATYRPEQPYGPSMAATAALSTLLGVMIGMLQVKGLLEREDAAAIFRSPTRCSRPRRHHSEPRWLALRRPRRIISATKISASRSEREAPPIAERSAYQSRQKSG